MSVLRFHWMRHAPPINPGDILYGADIPVDLSDKTLLANQAAKLPRNAEWFASTFERAPLTGRSVAAYHPDAATILITPHPGIVEQSFGDWEGRCRKDLRKDPDFILYSNDSEDARPPNGESLNDLANRVGPEIDKIVKARPEGGDVVMCCHGGVIRAALHHATGLPMGKTLKFAIDPLSISVIAYHHGKKNPWKVLTLNSLG